ncbi:MliC family protein [Mesorhizobium sp. A556]
MKRIHKIATAIAAGLASSASYAQQTQPNVTISIDMPAEAVVNSVTYGCGDGVSLSVSYVNADPNFLAIVPVEGKSIIFASAISGSGARYTSGRYEWWTKGDDAFLRDLTDDESEKPMLECKVPQN